MEEGRGWVMCMGLNLPLLVLWVEEWATSKEVEPLEAGEGNGCACSPGAAGKWVNLRGVGQGSQRAREEGRCFKTIKAFTLTGIKRNRSESVKSDFCLSKLEVFTLC